MSTSLSLPLLKSPRDLGFPKSGKESRTLPYAHVLDLADWGHIKPHIDSSRVSFHFMDILYNYNMLLAAQFCGSTVAVLSLLSPCLAR